MLRRRKPQLLGGQWYKSRVKENSVSYGSRKMVPSSPGPERSGRSERQHVLVDGHFDDGTALRPDLYGPPHLLLGALGGLEQDCVSRRGPSSTDGSQFSRTDPPPSPVTARAACTEPGGKPARLASISGQPSTILVADTLGDETGGYDTSLTVGQCTREDSNPRRAGPQPRTPQRTLWLAPACRARPESLCSIHSNEVRRLLRPHLTLTYSDQAHITCRSITRQTRKINLNQVLTQPLLKQC